MRIKIYSLSALIYFFSVLICNAQDIPPTTSLVFPGTDGSWYILPTAWEIKSLIFQMPDIKEVVYPFLM